ncbi:MAG: hypothetical protein ACXABY_15155 [Candidatus Thorarchaeota archaeon]
MNLPKKIKIGVKEIEIRYDAEIDPSRNLISTGHSGLEYLIVQKTLPKHVQAEAIFRGIVHVLCDICKLDHETKDRFRIGTSVLSIVRDNPQLVENAELPSVRIFGFDWKIVKEPEHYNHAGSQESNTMELHLNKAYTGKRGWLVLWHEILHAIFDKMELETETEERDVEMMSFLLCTMFTQNDFSWLLEDANEG